MWFQIPLVGGSANISSYFLITYERKRAQEGCNVAPKDGSKGAKHPSLAIELKVLQLIGKVI
jgi:hypothetical protein